MASINRAATKRLKDRRASDIIRLKAGEMLTYDNLVQQRNVAERQAMRKAAAASVVRNQNCLQLPLTIAYFTFYTWAMYLHEDITNVWLMESTMRRHTDSIFATANTIDDLWTNMISNDPNTGMVGVFFDQSGLDGELLSKNTTEDRWGLWGRVDVYNQIQGAVRIQQWRSSTKPFGVQVPCTSNLTCDLCRTGTGFRTVAALKALQQGADPQNPTPNQVLGPCASGVRRLEAEEERAKVSDGADSAAEPRTSPGRSLSQVWNPMLSSLPKGGEHNDAFTFYLYPGESQSQVQERLRYFKDRGWLDLDTNQIVVRMYILNAEMGRPRVEQLTVIISVSDAGMLYYQRDLQALFLLLFAGNINLLADLLFVLILLVTTGTRVVALWKAFVRSRLIPELTSLYTLLEITVAILGWLNVWGVWKLNEIKNSITDELVKVRALGWSLSPANDDILNSLFVACTAAADDAAWLRSLFASYSMGLMFRFFISFDSEPRLAIVTHTIKMVMTDLFHLAVIFLPGFMAFVISGSLLFGRFHPDFATLQGSIGYCFYAGFTANYDWWVLNQYNYWTAALWCWSFMLYINLLLLNILMAVILDVYDDIRLKNSQNEVVWETLYNYFLRLTNIRRWVQERVVESALREKNASTMISRADLEKAFPRMPEKQKDLLFAQSNKIMIQEAAKGLDKVSTLKLLGSMMYYVTNVNNTLSTIHSKESEDPVLTWVTPTVAIQDGKKGGEEVFLTQQVITKGGMRAHVEPPVELTPEEAEQEQKHKQRLPPWLQETKEYLATQKQWLEYADWNLKRLMWVVQTAHLAHCEDLENEAL